MAGAMALIPTHSAHRRVEPPTTHRIVYGCGKAIPRPSFDSLNAAVHPAASHASGTSVNHPRPSGRTRTHGVSGSWSSTSSQSRDAASAKSHRFESIVV